MSTGSDFELRSYLRKREAWFRKHPLHDAHVKQFMSTYSVWQRVLWVCPRCGLTMRRGDVPRDASNRLKRHCGCRTGVPPRLGAGVAGSIGLKSKSAQFKRTARVMALPGFKAVRHDSHVQVWKEGAKARLAKTQLHDAHVRAAKRLGAVWWHIRKKHNPNIGPQRRRRRQDERDNIGDGYITRLLTGGRKANPEAAGIPGSLVELKRVHLTLSRYLKRHEGHNL